MLHTNKESVSVIFPVRKRVRNEKYIHIRVSAWLSYARVWRSSGTWHKNFCSDGYMGELYVYYAVLYSWTSFGNNFIHLSWSRRIVSHSVYMIPQSFWQLQLTVTTYSRVIESENFQNPKNAASPCGMFYFCFLWNICSCFIRDRFVEYRLDFSNIKVLLMQIVSLQ
jgi:hypothetical protein